MRESRAVQRRAERSHGKKLISVSERRGILPLEGLVDTLGPICMSITPAENLISAPRLSGAVALNIGGEAEHSAPPCSQLRVSGSFCDDLKR